MTELIGFLGGIAFAVAFLPQLIKAVKTKCTEDVSWGMMALTLLGNCSMFLYTFLTGKLSPAFVFNYGGSLVLTTILCLLKAHYDKKS